MIIKSAIFFLKIVEAIWDAADWIVAQTKPLRERKSPVSTQIKSVKPSYQIR